MDGKADMFPQCLTCTAREQSAVVTTVVTYRYPGVVAGPARNEDESAAPLDLFDVVLQSTQCH